MQPAWGRGFTGPDRPSRAERESDGCPSFCLAGNAILQPSYPGLGPRFAGLQINFAITGPLAAANTASREASNGNQCRDHGWGDVVGCPGVE
jgi:hypothetical protein